MLFRSSPVRMAAWRQGRDRLGSAPGHSKAQSIESANPTMTSCVALIVAAGSGERFGGDRPKQYQDLGGRAVLHHTVSAFLRHDAVNAVQVVIQPAHRELYDAAVAGLGLPGPGGGGARPQGSGGAGVGG